MLLFYALIFGVVLLVLVVYVADSAERWVSSSLDSRRVAMSLRSERGAVLVATGGRKQTVIERPGPNWFTAGYAESMFTQHLSPHAGKEDFRVLQIGAYCGDASEWLLKNILTGKGSHLVDVDTWEGSDEEAHQSLDWDAVRAFYAERMTQFYNFTVFVGTSDAYFDMRAEKVFDFIYIDGSHQTSQVLRDAVNADRFLKVGGMIAFDDYRWTDGSRNTPSPAIDAFLRCFENTYEVIDVGLQVWVRKTR